MQTGVALAKNWSTASVVGSSTSLRSLLLSVGEESAVGGDLFGRVRQRGIAVYSRQQRGIDYSPAGLYFNIDG
jgi:hypothetical protein